MSTTPTTGFADHFAPVSTGYATFRPSYPDELFAALAAAAPSRDCVWDCGAGTGQASVALAAHFDAVIATDASASQVAQGAPHPRVSYRVAPAEASGLADASVALVTVAQALHWFDVDAFHVEASRVLVPGGVIAEWTYALLEVPSAPEVTGLVQAFDVAMGAYWPPERRFLDRKYVDFAFPFAPLALGTFAMEAEWTPAQLVGFLGTWSAVARCRAQTGADPLPVLVEQLSAGWGAADSRRVRWPLTLRVGRVG